MDASEARSVLEGAGVDLSEPDRNELLARTEGWPAGLYLAALAIKAGGPRAGPGVTFSGEDRFVGDYLRMEFLDRVSRADVSFLTRTSILDRLSGPLCDAVTESRGSIRVLHRLEQSNLMVVPLDRRGEWYRYHHLFQDLLRSELERREPGVIEGLHLRAADWYEANGSPVQAIEHLLLTGEGDRTARAMTPVLPTNHETGASSINLRWVSTLGDAQIERYPPLAVLVGWLAATQGDPRKADRWAAFVDAAVFDEAPGDGSASFDSARAMLRAIMCAHGPERMLTDALFAVEQEKPWSPWRPNALWLLAEAKLLTGATEEARHAFVEASSAAAASSRFAGLLLAEAGLALLAIDRGSWDEATDHLRLARATADEHGLQYGMASGLTSVGFARWALHVGDPKTASAEINRAMRVRPFATYGVPFIAVRLRLWLAKLHFALADIVAARHLLLEIDDILRHRPALGTLVDEVDKFRLDVDSSASAAVGPSPLSPAELRVLPYLQTHLTLGAIAARLFVSRHTVRSQVMSIYRKLGASSRQDAVERATAIGLLGASH